MPREPLRRDVNLGGPVSRLNQEPEDLCRCDHTYAQHTHAFTDACGVCGCDGFMPKKKPEELTELERLRKKVEKANLVVSVAEDMLGWASKHLNMNNGYLKALSWAIKTYREVK